MITLQVINEEIIQRSAAPSHAKFSANLQLRALKN